MWVSTSSPLKKFQVPISGSTGHISTNIPLPQRLHFPCNLAAFQDHISFIHIEKMSDIKGLFSLHNVLCLNFSLSTQKRKLLHRCTQARVLLLYMMGSGWQNVLSPQCGQGVKQVQMVLGRPSPSEFPAVQSDTGQVYLFGWSLSWLSWGTVQLST